MATLTISDEDLFDLVVAAIGADIESRYDEAGLMRLPEPIPSMAA